MDARRADEGDRGKYSQLEQNLVGPSPDEILPTTSATPVMEVVAPTKMEEGYQLDVLMQGKSVKITVPPGGVVEGQKFAVPIPTNASQPSVVGSPKVNVPVGQWKDALCSCCAYGFAHNHWMIACLCPLIGIAQVITRLQLNHLGQEGSVGDAASVFSKLFVTAMVGWSVFCMLSLMGVPVLPTIWLYAYCGITMYIVFNVRRHVRSKYAIRNDCNMPNPNVEDAVCSICCTQLVTAQMLRHTADYDTYLSTCCTDTGLPPSHPSIV